MPATPETLPDSGPPAADPFVGRTLLGRYEILSPLAEGGMGRVYVGLQRALNRRVAIKRIHPHLLTAPGIVERFMGEARVASLLAHPHIVRIFDFGRAPVEEGGDLFLVMELLDGIDLGTALGAMDRPPIAWSIDIVLQVLSALEEAHARRVTHRDIKPENVLLTTTRSGEDFVKLIDFGIAKMRGNDARLSRTETVGTPHFMAPEQVRGEEASPSADLYAVGAMLFRMLTGKMLFDGDSPGEVLHLQLTAPRPDPRTVAPERNIPAALAVVCKRAVSIEPADRYASADELAEALRSALATATLPPVRPSASPVLRALATSQTQELPQAPSTNPRPISSRYTLVPKRTDFASLHELDQRIRDALDVGDDARVVALLEDGVARARILSEERELELASIAWPSFAGRLAERWWKAGNREDAIALLRDARENLRHDAAAVAGIDDRLAQMGARTNRG